MWSAFRRTHAVRLRERYHRILLLMDGKSCPEIAQWLYRDEEARGTGCRPSMPRASNRHRLTCQQEGLIRARKGSALT